MFLSLKESRTLELMHHVCGLKTEIDALEVLKAANKQAGSYQ